MLEWNTIKSSMCVNLCVCARIAAWSSEKKHSFLSHQWCLPSHNRPRWQELFLTPCRSPLWKLFKEGVLGREGCFVSADDVPVAVLSLALHWSPSPLPYGYIWHSLKSIWLVWPILLKHCTFRIEWLTLSSRITPPPKKKEMIKETEVIKKVEIFCLYLMLASNMKKQVQHTSMFSQGSAWECSQLHA